jgi:hypothetical protein
MSTRNQESGGGGRRVEFCDSCSRVTDRRRRSDGIIEASRSQALRLMGGMFR